MNYIKHNSFLLRTLTLLSLLFIVSCGDESTSPSYGKIEGVVIDANTGEPINAAMIFTEPGTESVITTPEGKFTLNSIDVGNYTVRAVKSKYKTSYTNVRVLENKTVSASILLFPGEGNINLDSLNENRPPSKPVTLTPKNDATITGDFVELRWNSIDPEGDEITYNLYFGKSSVGQNLLINNLITTKYIVSDLEELTTYYWKVEAIDEYGNKSMSNVFSFYIDTVGTADNGEPKITDGLLAYISFDGEIKDNSGNNTIELSGVNLVSDRNNRINSAGYFNYQTNYLNILGLPNEIKDYSISFWINPNTNYGNPYNGQIHIAGRYGLLENGSMKIHLENNNQLNYAHNTNGNVIVDINKTLNSKIWTHITLTYNSSTLVGKFYLNGTLIHTKFNLNFPSPANSPFAIGMDVMNNNRVFNGAIDEFYLFNRALSESEVNQLYSK